VNKLLLSAFALVVAVALAPADDKKPDDKKGEKADNPGYASWAKFKPDTKVVMKSSFEFNGMKFESKTSTKLVEVKDDKLVVEDEVTSVVDGKESKLPASKRDVPKQLDAAPPGLDPKTGKPTGTTDEGKEKLKIGGTEYECKWYKFKTKQKGFGGEEEEIEGQVWMSDDLPGKVAKSNVKLKAGAMTMEITDITIKK
jgi:uncharacterized protein YodC (DUF2158 family)